MIEPSITHIISMIPLLPVTEKIDGSISWDPRGVPHPIVLPPWKPPTTSSWEVRLPDAMWLVWDNGLIRTMRRGSADLGWRPVGVGTVGSGTFLGCDHGETTIKNHRM